MTGITAANSCLLASPINHIAELQRPEHCEHRYAIQFSLDIHLKNQHHDGINLLHKCYCWDLPCKTTIGFTDDSMYWLARAVVLWLLVKAFLKLLLKLSSYMLLRQQCCRSQDRFSHIWMKCSVKKTQVVPTQRKMLIQYFVKITLRLINPDFLKEI